MASRTTFTPSMRQQLPLAFWPRGDPALQADEDRLAQRPPITVPAVTIDGTRDPLKPGGTADDAPMFTGRHAHAVIDAGHNLPQEQPAAFADAVLRVHGWRT